MRQFVFHLALPLTLALLAGCGDGRSSRSDSSSTPLASASPSPVATIIACPTSVTLAVDGAAVDLDLGTGGVNHDTHFNEGDTLTLAVACSAATAADCGNCTITGPLAPAAGIASRRCLHATNIACQRDDECPGSRCADLFGPPLPLTAGGVPSCVVAEIVSAGPGTYGPASGQLMLPLHLQWQFFVGIDVGISCPRCSGAGPGDRGVCEGGARDGESCTVHGTEPLLGNTSYDCPPNPSAFLTTLDLPMDLTTGTSFLAPDEHCVSDPFVGRPCFCPQQALPNDCIDGQCEVEGDSGAVCRLGPMDHLCAVESFRGCTSDADCPRAGDHCAGHLRPCSAPATGTDGNVDALVRSGRAGATSPLLVATFCVAPTTTAVFNQGIGLPGPAAIRLPVTLR
jgi:hypothetical protein